MFGSLGLERIAEVADRLGFDGIELLADPSRYAARTARRILSDRGLSVLSLTPGDADPAHPDRMVRGDAIDRYRRMVDLAAGVGAPLLGFHGAVGRTAPISDRASEERLLLESARAIGEYAGSGGVRLAVEVLNRYESHLIYRAEQAVEFVRQADCPHVGVLLDTYHMNIEEPDPAVAVEAAGSALFALHVADSNRRGIGRGHLPFDALFDRLETIGYEGDVIVESSAPGIGPFAAAESAADVARTMDEAGVSLAWLRNRRKGLQGSGSSMQTIANTTGMPIIPTECNDCC